MTDAKPAHRKELEERQADLESRYTHLQRVVETLNEVVIEQAKQLDQLHRKFHQLTNQLEPLLQAGAEPRTLEEDKPPHY